MNAISDALGVSRRNLGKTSKTEPGATRGTPRKGRFRGISDAELRALIEVILKTRPTYGYKRMTAMLNRNTDSMINPVNHKRVYRVMKDSGLLLPKFVGYQPERKHEGKVQTLRTNTRWCSDSFQIRCWDGRKIETVFVLDTCDREVLSMVSVIGHLDAKDASDALALAFEKRFKGRETTPNPIEWLTDNGGIFVASETKYFAKEMGFIPCQTPAYSPESNGMSESFVKRFKQDYVYVNDLDCAEEVLRKIASWAEDYNQNHPHKALKMMSPNEFRMKMKLG
jgi:putative transposase